MGRLGEPETASGRPTTTIAGAQWAVVGQEGCPPDAPGQGYRFTLRAEDGTIAGSWAFQARAPLHVVSVLPGDKTTGVPVTTGIEVTFDQDAAADMGPFFTISPAVGGRFERHARPPHHAGSSTRSSERLGAGNGAARAQAALS